MILKSSGITGGHEGRLFLVGRLVPSLWDDGGEEGADEGPRGGEEAGIVDNGSRVPVPCPPGHVLHPLIHQALLGHG